MNVIDYISETLFLDDKELLRFAATAPYRYKKYYIEKRNGNGRRLIAHPSSELKLIQSLAIKFLDEHLKVHEASYAYKSGVSIKDNALIHVKSNFLLKMDFEDFFNSIKPVLLFRVLKKRGVNFSSKERTFLNNLFFYRQYRGAALRLSVGAPSSPVISNVVMYYFDTVMSTYCSQHKINYSRYADDITFSTNKRGALLAVPSFVAKVLNNETYGKITINAKKTIFSSKAHNRHVTGITLSNDGVLSIGRDRKRLISSMVHKYSHNLLNEEEIGRLKGLLSFSYNIEPCFISRLNKKYGLSVMSELVSEKLIKAIKI
jgi:RNA-directed DNA polymerase